MWTNSVTFCSCLCLAIILILGIPTEAKIQTTPVVEEWQVYQVVGREMHNRFRAKHNAPPLKLNETLNRAAQEFANHMLKEKTSSYKRGRESSSKNQETFKSYPEIPLNTNEAVKKAVTKWYSLITRAHWNNQNYSAFSALAWKGTTDLGIGVASNGARIIVVAAYYSNPGNSELNEVKAKSVAIVSPTSTTKIRPYVTLKRAEIKRITGQGIK